MAASMPLPPKAQVPVTPPPEFQLFMNGPPFQIPKPFVQDTAQDQATGSEPQESATQATQPSQPPTQPPQPPTPSEPAGAFPWRLPPDPAAAAGASAAFDPRYFAMASRIASYYQQRCQALANFQQQRCQAWANAQRQKCQEMTQAATVIVAWYIRDRIKRRRRRQKRAFKRGLAHKAAVASSARGGVTTKGEAVRRWVMDVPLGAASPPSRELPVDKEEVDFDMDREAPADKDSQLFSVAENLIKSHLATVDVPLLGVLSFDESESESEEENEEENEAEDAMDYRDEEEEDEEDHYDYDAGEMTGDMDEHDVNDSSRAKGGGTCISKDVQLGTTTKGSRKRSRSSVS